MIYKDKDKDKGYLLARRNLYEQCMSSDEWGVIILNSMHTENVWIDVEKKPFTLQAHTLVWYMYPAVKEPAWHPAVILIACHCIASYMSSYLLHITATRVQAVYPLYEAHCTIKYWWLSHTCVQDTLGFTNKNTLCVTPWNIIFKQWINLRVIKKGKPLTFLLDVRPQFSP